MASLQVESLQVTSFETTPEPAEASVGIHTQNNPLCYSPWCVPSFDRVCPADGTA